MNDGTGTQQSLVELVGSDALDALRESFEVCVGLPLLFTDPHRRPLTDVAEPTRFCPAFVHGLDHGGERTAGCCRGGEEEPASDAEALAMGPPVIATCAMGFMYAVVPIRLKEHLLGFALSGHALESAPDLDALRRRAEGAGMDPEACVEAADRARIMPRERIESAAELLHAIAGLVVRAADDTLQAEKVRELERTRDELTHMIVHDLRTPLTAIISSLQAMHDGTLGPVEGFMEQIVTLSLKTSKRLLGMVNDLLDIGKMEAERMSLVREPVQLRSIVDGALGQVSYLAQDRSISMEAHIPEDMPALYVDLDKVDRVFVNLLGNALRFTPPGGSIAVRASHPGQDGQVLVAVSDNGSGIPQEDRERIFDKFVQARARRAGRGTSSGLGLTFCRMTVEAHGGHIWVESMVGEGSTFFFTLPTA